MRGNKALLTSSDLLGLDAKEINFVIEYMKDYDPRRAAERAGYHPDTGNGLLQKQAVIAAIHQVASHRLSAADIDAQWLMLELVDNHILARQAGKLTASNQALGTIARLAAVDAFAADKVLTVSDEAVLSRLQRARGKLFEGEAQISAGGEGTPEAGGRAIAEEEVSFL